MVELICSFTTDFYISGIAALVEPSQKSELNLVLLGFAKELDEDGSAKRPTLQVVQPVGNDYIEVRYCAKLVISYWNCVISKNFTIKGALYFLFQIFAMYKPYFIKNFRKWARKFLIKKLFVVL